MRFLLGDSLHNGMICTRTLLRGKRCSNAYQRNSRFFQGAAPITPRAAFSTTRFNANTSNQPDPPPPSTEQPKPRRLDPHNAERQEARLVSRDTRALLPEILQSTARNPPDGFLVESEHLPQLQRRDCPGFTGVKIQVVDMDTVDAAIRLAKNDSTTTTSSTSDAEIPEKEDYGHPCILIMSNGDKPGGVWIHGARTQEETICRRTTLVESLKPDFYPLPAYGAVYSPSIVVFRESPGNRYRLMDLNAPDKLPVISAITMAPIRKPEVVQSPDARAGGAGNETYKNPEDRDVMKEKMRVILRISVMKGKRRIVLGAFGCGAFKNPKGEVADCWAEVFGEPEFQGGWWKDVVFAVWDPPRLWREELCVWNAKKTAPIFIQRLHGMKV